MPDKRWKRHERRTADQREDWERVPGSGAFTRGDGNVVTTKADVWAPDFFIECKQRKSMPLWDEFKEIRAKARRYDKRPLLLLDHPDEALRLAVFDMDDLDEVERLHLLDLGELFSVFHVVHRTSRREWVYEKWTSSLQQAELEEKPLMLSLQKVRCPGQLGVLEAP